MQIALGGHQLAGGPDLLDRRSGVGEDDLVEIDVPPTAGRVVDDLDACGAPGQVAHVPAGFFQCLAAPWLRVGARGRAHDASLDEQVHAGLAGITAAADQECDVIVIELEFTRGERAQAVVAPQKTIDQPLALESADGHLTSQRSGRGPRAEGGPRCGPGPVIFSFEVRKHDVAAARRRGQGQHGERRSDEAANPREQRGRAVHGSVRPID